MPHPICYEFGPYHLDLSRRVLTRAGETISLTPKATDILIMLVINAGQLVEKDLLLKEIWPDTFVEEANLTQNIFTLRRALGDERAGPKYIETVARRGYRFIATVRAVDPDANGEGSIEALQLQQTLGLSANSVLVVAVLPFINATGNPDLEYLAEGVTDNIINNLSRISKLRVMSRSAVFRYKTKEIDPQEAGRKLHAAAVLVGKINSRPASILIEVELIDPSTGWQLWGENFDLETRDLLQTQDAITTQVLAALKLKLTGDEEKRVTARYTENAEAYQSYLEGRHHWSTYTRKGIERAIHHFRRAIELDANYALAYAGIIDCYLRLTTNYLPPEDDVPAAAYRPTSGANDSDPRVRLRFEWDWKGAERELRRANELQTNYPTAHQWYAAYLFSKGLYQKQLRNSESPVTEVTCSSKHQPQLFSSTLTPNEEVQVSCTVTREQIEIGNYDAGCLVLAKWWTPGEWPKLDALTWHAAADLLFTTGCLASCLSSTGRIQSGQKHAEDLLSGSIGIFEHLGAKRRSAEGRIELALSYYRQGMFGISRSLLLRVLANLESKDTELRSLGLIRLGVVDRHAGHISDSLSRFSEAYPYIEEGGPLLTGRYYHELGTTLEEIALAENRSDHIETVIRHFQRSFYEFVAIGHHRYAAVVENNQGFLLLKLGRFDEAEGPLIHARKLFESLSDIIRTAQVDDTLARLYIATNRLHLSDLASQRAVTCLERVDEDALLAEALTTRGVLLCKLNRYNEARVIFEGARRIAERCGDDEGAGRALLALVEEMHDHLDIADTHQAIVRMRDLLLHTQMASIRHRLEKCLTLPQTHLTDDDSASGA